MASHKAYREREQTLIATVEGAQCVELPLAFYLFLFPLNKVHLFIFRFRNKFVHIFCEGSTITLQKDF